MQLPQRALHLLNDLRSGLASQPWLLSFLPVFALAGFLYGIEGVLWAVAVSLPVIAAVSRAAIGRQVSEEVDGLTGLMNRRGALRALERLLDRHGDQTDDVLLYIVEIDFFSEFLDRMGGNAVDDIQKQIGERLIAAVRGSDMVARLSSQRFAVAIKPARQTDIDAALLIAERLQREIGLAFTVDASSTYLSCSIGFCMARRLADCTPETLIDGAQVALEEARRHGEGAIRSYSSQLSQTVARRHELMSEVREAFDNDEIWPWFQPQVSTDTGEIVGFEALARWRHPERGMIPPADFLDAIEYAGLMPHLAQTMLRKSLNAMASWETKGLRVKTIGVNFSNHELRDPKLPDRVKWELDRVDLSPDRLTIEVLETVVADTENDTVTRNISALARLGCTIDLDDFGTGSASIANIRRFAVNRLKIDRSFVTNVDTDRNQQKMVSAILLMAEQLDLETLAEGVETAGEHALLAQLGCGSVQGFGISRPMAFEDTVAWMTDYNERRAETLHITPRAQRSG
ncbi:bifunctional diguanylate cyclase/phosphodiesterase [Actibacterium sp. 188UL27-1]|uniref:putative bifunctional diguanylate cyclase/phosphodiesterase n=1 Tax=Actibacterium sp. 188UL27-1 TaxID=2786961 RepID=UPI001959AEA6|nr:bifunctional diguanylate cyclase/phosphodiesterase [Actibacterium sp. 188UL27-1]MBM7069958.1 bifunctional diguanylate cyclase/phosphodiesterase [Actibacterium sp. 188UL27-1]